MWLTILNQNLDIVFFVYGIAFFTIGVAILIQPRKDSIFRLSNILWLLAAFGLTHGLNEWLDMYDLTKWSTSQIYDQVQLIVLTLSYIFFFEFGRRLLFLSSKRFFITKKIAIIFYSFVFALTFLPLRQESSIWPRYLLGFPAGLLTALGFIFYYRDNETTLGPLGVRGFFLTASFAVAAYGILGGFITPRAEFYPADIINNNSFLEAVGIPVQMFRAICAIVLTWSIWNILGIFNWEIKEKLKADLEEIALSKSYVDNIITSIADSLLVVDADAQIKTVNLATQQLLGYKNDELIGMPIGGVFVEKEIEEILNEIEEAAFLLSKDFRIIEANRAFLKMAGLSLEETRGRHCYELTHNIKHVCNLPTDKCPIKGVQEQGAPCVELHAHFDKRGQKYLVNVAAMPIRDKAGEVSYYLHLSKNVEKTEDGGRLPDGDSQSLKLLINKLETYVDTLKMRMIFHETDLTKLSATRSFRNLDMYYKTKAQGKIPISLSGSVMNDKTGKFLGIVCIARDMREIKRLQEREKEIIAAKATLEAEHKRAQELEKVYKELEASHEELKAAQYQLIEAEKMQIVGRLASGVAHEVKNPLAVIIQGVEYLRERARPKDKNIPLTLKYMEEAVYRADSVIKGLLDFSASSKLDLRPADLNSIIDKSLLITKHQFDKYHIQLIKDFAPGLPEFKIDKNKIEHVFVNLILNAIQAMPGGGKLTIKTYLEEAAGEGRWLVSQFEDTGKGIPQDIRDKIFDPFFTTKRDIGGTGLGLTIVKNIVQMHGGKIAVENRKDGPGVKAVVMFKT